MLMPSFLQADLNSALNSLLLSTRTDLMEKGSVAAIVLKFGNVDLDLLFAIAFGIQDNRFSGPSLTRDTKLVLS